LHQRESAFQQPRDAGDEHRATPPDRRASGERHTAILRGDRHALEVGIGLHRLRERGRRFLRKRDEEIDFLLLQRFNDQSCGFGIHRFSLHCEKKAPALHRATASVSADIAQDRKSCQFAFLLDEKPTVVSA
jgi:hypothetical protein